MRTVKGCLTSSSIKRFREYLRKKGEDDEESTSIEYFVVELDQPEELAVEDKGV